MVKNIIFFLLFIVGFTIAAPNFISSVWPQRGLVFKEFGNAGASKRVLISGYTSPFKDSIIAKVVDTLVHDSSLVRIESMEQLSGENLSKWSAIVFVNTCMAGNINSRVNKFIASHSKYTSFIIVTTSGNSKGCSIKRTLPNADAISSASVKEKCATVVNETIQSIRNVMRKK